MMLKGMREKEEKEGKCEKGEEIREGKMKDEEEEEAKEEEKLRKNREMLMMLKEMRKEEEGKM